MIVRYVNHPRLNEGVDARQQGSNQAAKLGDRLRDAVRLPFMAVNPAADEALEFVITKRVRLADEQSRDRWKLVTMLDSE